jgi:hypothetical protein
MAARRVSAILQGVQLVVFVRCPVGIRLKVINNCLDTGWNPMFSQRAGPRSDSETPRMSHIQAHSPARIDATSL